MRKSVTLILIVTAVLCFLLSMACLLKYNELQSIIARFDGIGDGIGLYFLGIEINDRLPKEQIPLYISYFYKWSVILFIISTLSFLISVVNSYRIFKADSV